MSEVLNQAIIKEYCKSLRSPRIGSEYPRFVREATENGWSYEEFLQRILEEELNARREGLIARRLKEAKFPEIKTLDQVDWNELQGVSRPAVQQLATCGFLQGGEDVILAGPM